jgi:hypothetical protein
MKFMRPWITGMEKTAAATAKNDFAGILTMNRIGFLRPVFRLFAAKGI